jgi:hypothetical protein
MSQSLLGELADNLIDALFLGMRDHTVQIGHVPGMRPEHSHGVIHAMNAQGRTEHIGFVAQNPKKLTRPHPESIASLFKQARVLGFDPKQIELRVGKYRRVYEEHKLEPVYVQPL